MKTRDYKISDVEISGRNGDVSVAKTRNWNLFFKDGTNQLRDQR